MKSRRGRWVDVAGKAYTDRLDEPVITIGRDVITFREIGKVLGAPHIVAARRLNEAVQVFKPKSIIELAGRMTVDQLIASRPGVGVTTVVVWMWLLEHAGRNPERWYNRPAKIATVCTKRRKKR